MGKQGKRKVQAAKAKVATRSKMAKKAEAKAAKRLQLSEMPALKSRAATAASKGSALALCGRPEELTLQPCENQMPCAEHKDFDRASHLRAGMPTKPKTPLRNYDTCGAKECAFEEGDEAKIPELQLCEGCMLSYHLECSHPSATLMDNVDGDEIYLCGSCAENPEVFNLIPAKLRKPKAPAPKGKQAKSAAELENALNGKGGTDADDDDDDDAASAEKKKLEAEEEALMKKLEEVRAKRKAPASPAGRASAKRGAGAEIDPATVVVSSDEEADADDGAGADATKIKLTPRHDKETIKELKTTRRVELERLRTDALKLKDQDVGRRRYHHDDSLCNLGDKCLVGKAEGAWYFDAGDRIDGAYAFLLQRLCGSARSDVWTDAQRNVVTELRKTRNCTKKDFPYAVYAELCLSDTQVLRHLEILADGWEAEAATKAEADLVCASQMRLIENIKRVVGEVRTLTLRPDEYADVPALEYVTVLLQQAHAGRIVDLMDAPNTPRQCILQAILLKRSCATGGNPKKSESTDAKAKYKPNAGAGEEEVKVSGGCFNCKAYGLRATDHTADECKRPTKIKCKIDGCQKLHKRKDHK